MIHVRVRARIRIRIGFGLGLGLGLGFKTARENVRAIVDQGCDIRLRLR